MRLIEHSQRKWQMQTHKTGAIQHNFSFVQSVVANNFVQIALLLETVKMTTWQKIFLPDYYCFAWRYLRV